MMIENRWKEFETRTTNGLHLLSLIPGLMVERATIKFTYNGDARRNGTVGYMFDGKGFVAREIHSPYSSLEDELCGRRFPELSFMLRDRPHGEESAERSYPMFFERIVPQLETDYSLHEGSVTFGSRKIVIAGNVNIQRDDREGNEWIKYSCQAYEQPPADLKAFVNALTRTRLLKRA